MESALLLLDVDVRRFIEAREARWHRATVGDLPREARNMKPKGRKIGATIGKVRRG